MNILFVFSFCLAAVAAGPARDARIVGGTVTNIQAWPYTASVLFGSGNFFRQSCAGSIITSRSILSAAHCFRSTPVIQIRIRVGSTYSNAGGIVFTTQQYVNHPGFVFATADNDITVLRINGNFTFNNNVRPGMIAGAGYNLHDNQPVWAVGWGAIRYNGPTSANLRQVQIWTVNQDLCRAHYLEVNVTITDNMLCMGWLNFGSRGTCTGDSGGPIIHGTTIVGITSFGYECAHPRYPSVSARVSRFTNWIVNNA